MTFKGEYTYWGREGTDLLGDPSVDQNIPFNPIRGWANTQPKLVDEKLYTFDKLTPHSIYTTEIAPGLGPIETSFRDPFLMLTYFPHKVIGGTWGTGTGTINADFTAQDDVDTIWQQIRLKDLSSTNHLNRLLRGGLPDKYAWIIEPGKLIAEQADVKWLNFISNTQAPSISNDFHNQSFGSGIGGWANWDNTGLNGTGKRSVTDMVIEFGGSSLTFSNIKSFQSAFDVGYESEQIYSSLNHTIYYQRPQNYRLEMTGKLADLTALEEYEKIYSLRTPQTLKLYYDATVDEEKYIQCTNCVYIPESGNPDIPEAGKTTDITVIIEAGESFDLSFSGKYLDLVDPTPMITT